MSKRHIEECIRDSLERYFKDLRGAEPHAMHEMIMTRSRSRCSRW